MTDPDDVIDVTCHHCGQTVAVTFQAPDPGEDHGILLTPLSGDRHPCPALAIPATQPEEVTP